MSFSGIILGLINILIVIVLFLLVGAIIVAVMKYLEWPVPPEVRKLYLALVALIALYLLVALLFGLPVVHIIHTGVPPTSVPHLAATPSIIAPEQR